MPFTDAMQDQPTTLEFTASLWLRTALGIWTAWLAVLAAVLGG